VHLKLGADSPAALERKMGREKGEKRSRRKSGRSVEKGVKRTRRRNDSLNY
jgi:hypothetical protein